MDFKKGQVRDEAFELGVFVTQLFELTGFAGRHAAIDFLPAIERLLGDPDLAADIEWSPDGKRIAFGSTRDRSSDNSIEIDFDNEVQRRVQCA